MSGRREEGDPEMSRYELQDKIAIVTGGAGSTGKYIALGYAKAGANVVVASRNQENLDKVAAEIKSLGRESLAIATDICVPERVDNLVKQTVDKFGRIDILVNNAGGILSFKEIEDLSLEDWDADIAFNLTGPFLCCAAVGKLMIEQKHGKIINVSSGAGVTPSPSFAAYSAAKAGIINMTLTLAAGWAQHNINVNCISPGQIATEGARRAGMLPPEKNEDGMPVPPQLFPPSPEDIADLAVFLASAASDHIHGEIIPIRALGR